MLLDDALRGTLRNFSTVFLVIFGVIGPLHFLYGLMFHDVLELRELHAAISEFPAGRQVRGVGRDALSRAQIWFWVLAVIELLLLPLFVRVAAHVIALDEEGEVPTAVKAWGRFRNRAAPTQRSGGGRAATISVSVLVGLAVGFLTHASLLVIADLLPSSAAFAIIALARSVGLSAGAAFVVVALVYATGGRGEPSPGRVPDLYK